MPTVTLLYFASLRERAGIASETLSTQAPDLAGVYDDAQSRHGFTWPREHLRVANFRIAAADLRHRVVAVGPCLGRRKPVNRSEG